MVGPQTSLEETTFYTMMLLPDEISPPLKCKEGQMETHISSNNHNMTTVADGLWILRDVINKIERHLQSPEADDVRNNSSSSNNKGQVLQ